MYHVSAQGVDERMVNVHYYYYIMISAAGYLWIPRFSLYCIFHWVARVSSGNNQVGRRNVTSWGLCRLPNGSSYGMLLLVKPFVCLLR